MGIYDINYDLTGKNDSGGSKNDGEMEASFLRLYIILANSQQLNSLMQTIEMNRDFLNKYDLTYQYLFKPMQSEWAVYQEVEVRDGDRIERNDSQGGSKRAREGHESTPPEVA